MMDGRCDCKDRKWANSAIGVKCPYCGVIIHMMWSRV